MTHFQDVEGMLDLLLQAIPNNDRFKEDREGLTNVINKLRNPDASKETLDEAINQLIDLFSRHGVKDANAVKDFAGKMNNVISDYERKVEYHMSSLLVSDRNYTNMAILGMKTMEIGIRAMRMAAEVELLKSWESHQPKTEVKED